jgi:molecular chaperone DnaK
MRNKIDYGIDLGTTNSAIARMENGVPTIKKSDTLKDTIPSCVHINKKQDILIGDTAFNVMKNDSARALKTLETGKTNTFIEFKRTMGTTSVFGSSNLGKNLSSEELSAEVLKKLKSFIQDENVNSIVITVPAKFLNPQNEATIKAAKLAGFKHVELLQEPVAASTAYGLDAKNKDGFWLVFDFGGGTFDAALVKSDEGILLVKDTDGDNWLGGKNLDEAIVDEIIIPNIIQNFDIENLLKDSKQKEILRNAVKFYAEETKIQLSFKDTHNILSNLGDLPFEDENGNEIEIDVEVNQQDMERVLGPVFQKAIDIAKNLLKRNNLKGDDLATLILVGGPTFSPVLRRMLKEQITVNVDTSVDPMTVVAKGAALFASTISVSDEVKEATRDNTKLQLEINYEATTVELDEMINIKVLKEKTIGIFPDKIYADVVRFDGAWSSGKKLIGEKTSLVDVQLIEGRSNSFDILVYDELGNKLECEPRQFSILQGIGGLNSMQVLPYYIGIGKYFQSEEKDLFFPAKGLEKNKTLPATGVINGLKTRTDIRPGMKQDFIRIPIYQGDYDAERTNPALNNFVTEIILTGETLPKLLPASSDVDITIKVDKSQTMIFTAYFPILDHTEELTIEIKSTSAVEIPVLSAQIAKAKRTANKLGDNEVSHNIAILEEKLENKGGNEAGRMEIQDGLRKELLKLEETEKLSEWPKVEAELKQEFYDFEDLIKKIKVNGDTDDIDLPKIEASLQEFKTNIEQIIKIKDTKAAKELIELIGFLEREIRNEVTGGGVDVSRLKYHDEAFDTINWKDKNKARMLVNQGLQLIANGQTKALRPLLQQIWALRIDAPNGDDDDGKTLG